MYIFITGLFMIAVAMFRRPAVAKKPGSVMQSFHLTNISMALLLTTLILDRLFI